MKMGKLSKKELVTIAGGFAPQLPRIPGGGTFPKLPGGKRFPHTIWF